MLLATAAKDLSENIIPAGLLTFLLGLTGLFVRYLSRDRGAYEGIAGERKDENAALRSENELLHQEIGEQRKLKHAANNQLAICQMTVDTVRRLAGNCTCGALEAVRTILDRED